ncbi:MAG TPA: hypothetical protein VKQ27_18635 [Acetobacteraceae bacterium]|nr:hypothetical protein [Acetobacteraceae bacterium]
MPGLISRFTGEHAGILFRTVEAHQDHLIRGLHDGSLDLALTYSLDLTEEIIAHYMRDLIGHAPYAQSQQVEFRAWLKQFAHWLFDTDHISVRYEIVYDGIDIRKLSPGTRGIVLLLLYLALDDGDDRPLIIDQPEENLDPKSVFEELVALFVAAKAKRQVIMVAESSRVTFRHGFDCRRTDDVVARLRRWERPFSGGDRCR